MKTLISLTYSDDCNLQFTEVFLQSMAASGNLDGCHALATIRKIRAAFAETETIAKAVRS